MEVIIAAAGIVIFIAGRALFFSAQKARRREVHIRLVIARFALLSSVHKVRFSSQEILEGGAIGVDGIHGKILLLGGDGLTRSHLLHFGEIRNCTVQKYYSSSERLRDEANRNTFLSKLVLRFELRRAPGSIDVVFYNHLMNSKAEAAVLARRAAAWQIILSKMIIRKSPVH